MEVVELPQPTMSAAEYADVPADSQVPTGEAQPVVMADENYSAAELARLAWGEAVPAADASDGTAAVVPLNVPPVAIPVTVEALLHSCNISFSYSVGVGAAGRAPKKSHPQEAAVAPTSLAPPRSPARVTVAAGATRLASVVPAPSSHLGDVDQALQGPAQQVLELRHMAAFYAFLRQRWQASEADVACELAAAPKDKVEELLAEFYEQKKTATETENKRAKRGRPAGRGAKRSRVQSSPTESAAVAEAEVEDEEGESDGGGHDAPTPKRNPPLADDDDVAIVSCDNDFMEV